MTGIGGLVDHKAKMYKNQACRKKKVNDGRQQDLARRKRKLLVLG
jgi:hypothetical protein